MEFDGWSLTVLDGLWGKLAKMSSGTSRTTGEGPLTQGLEGVPLNSCCRSCHLVVLKGSFKQILASLVATNWKSDDSEKN